MVPAPAATIVASTRRSIFNLSYIGSSAGIVIKNVVAPSVQVGHQCDNQRADTDFQRIFPNNPEYFIHYDFKCTHITHDTENATK